MIVDSKTKQRPVTVSIGIFAWNEERALRPMLASLFQQTLFAWLEARQEACEIVCVANGCTDRTVPVAREVFDAQALVHPLASAFRTGVADIAQRGKVNAWNQYVHNVSAPEAKVLFMMDADIVLHQPETLWRMLLTLEQTPGASVAVDVPRKDISFKKHLSWRERFSLAASRMTQAAPGQLCAQLYAIRAGVARNILMPRDLAACEDGFLKTIVCTDFLTDVSRAERIQPAAGAEHTFEAYTSPAALLKNQKRQALGQTIVHVLADQCLKQLPAGQRRNLAQTLRAREAADPDWLKRLIAEHLGRVRFFWRLYPGLLGQRVRGWQRLSPRRRVVYLPALLAGSVATLWGSWLAYRSLKAGCTDYWPRAERVGLEMGNPAPGRQTVPTHPSAP